MTWFLETVKADNKAACENMKIIMTDKDATERGAIRQVFPNATLKVCIFHALQAFGREVTRDSMGVDSKTREECLTLFQNLVYSESLEHFKKNYSTFRKSVPEKVLAYYEKNWHPIKEDWSEYALRHASFLNFTNNRIECLNGKAKDSTGKNNPLENAVEKLLLWNENRRRKQITERVKRAQREEF